MCAPVVAGVMIASAIASAYSKYREGQANAAMNEAQARAQEMQAADARQRGAIEAGMQRMQTSQDIADQQLAYGAAGVDASTGSAMDVQVSTRGLGEYEALVRENDAIREAWGFETSAKMSRFKANNAMSAATNDAVATLIGGGAQAAGAMSSGKFSVPARSQLATTTG